VQDLAQARTLLEEAAATAADTDNRRICDMTQAMQEFAERHSGEVHYLGWPIRELTEPLGVEKGDFIIVGGRPSTGKTALTIQCAYHWAKRHRVGYFSLETNRHKVADRLVSHAASISKNRIRRNQMTDDDWTRWAQVSGERITRTGLEIIEAAGMSVSQIQALSTMRGYEIIVVDYLQLIEEPARSSYESVTMISKKLHTLAQKSEITVVALSQLSRMDKSAPRHANMSDLRESGQIEQDADIILMLNPLDPKKPAQEQNRLLRVEKNKEGQLCEIELEFFGELQTFRKAPPKQKEPVTLGDHMGRDPGPPAPEAPPWQPSAADYEYVGGF
jgi:replicative DNA helicase